MVGSRIPQHQRQEPVSLARGRAEVSTLQKPDNHDEELYWELFHRAIILRDEACWNTIVTAFDCRVRYWCRRATQYQIIDMDDAVGMTWERFVRYYNADKLESATSLRQILHYLHLCAHSVVTDAVRDRTTQPESAPIPEDLPDGARSVADLCIDRDAKARLWDVIMPHLKDERERVLLLLRYHFGLTSAQVQATRPDLFPTMKDVYLITRLILDRLKRSQTLREWYGAQSA